MSFKFNFDETDTESLVISDNSIDDENKNDFMNNIVLNVEKHHIDVIKRENLPVHIAQIGSSSLRYVSSSYVENILQCDSQHSEISQVLENESDVQVGIYEGGFKVWECSIDLVNFLLEQKIDFSGLSILELGCGAGLPGIYCLQFGGFVYFQDFNREVLDFTTIPNVLLNTVPESWDALTENCKFIAGNWKKMDSIPDNCFDMILTSETIYNPSHQSDLYNVIKSKLKRDGIAFLAAKTHYFGVGGGMRQFENVVSEDGIMASAIVKKFEEGVQREIMKLTFLS